MDEHVRAISGDSQQDEDIPISTAGQVMVRTLPACAVAVIGMPVLAWLLLDADGEARTWWWPLSIIALIGLAMLIHYFAQAPRPRLDKRVSKVRWKGALSSAPKFGTVPTDPDVRTAAGVVACNGVETIVFVVAFFLGGILAVLIRPEYPWLEAADVPMVVALIWVFRSRHGWSYLKALHSGSRTD